MAGLLGDGFEDPRSAAIMALAGGLLKRDFGGGLLGANDAFARARAAQTESEDRMLRRGLLSAQVDETKAQAEERKSRLALAQRAQDNQNRLLFGDSGVMPTQSSGGPVVGGPAGFSGAAASNPSPDARQSPQGGGLIAQARAMGIPEQAIQADVAFNGGKGISDMLFKRGTPDMQVTNGYAWDKNRAGAGFVPQLNMSQDGKASMVRIGPDGLPVVSAPSGALNTFAGYQNVQEGTKANYDPVTVTPQGQNPQMTSRGALMRNPQVQGTQVQPGQQAQMDQGRAEILNQELTKAQAQLKTALQSGDAAAANRAASDVSALNRELGRAGGQSRATLGLPLQSEAEKAAQVDQAKADVVPTAQRQSQIEANKQTLAVLDKAIGHPGLDNATGLSSVLDPRNYIPGTDAKDFNVVMDQIKGKAFLQAFESLKGGGAITQVEGEKAGNAIARLNQAQSAKEFRGALNDLRDIVVRADGRLTGGGKEATPEAPKPQTFQQLPSAAQYKGKIATNPATGQRMRSNGLTWVEEK